MKTLIICGFLLAFNHIFSPIYGLEEKRCYIKNQAKHEENQKIFQKIIEKELASAPANLEPSEQAKYLCSNVATLAKELLKNGFLNDAYGRSSMDKVMSTFRDAVSDCTFTEVK